MLVQLYGQIILGFKYSNRTLIFGLMLDLVNNCSITSGIVSATRGAGDHSE